jgi:hypothetical protein
MQTGGRANVLKIMFLSRIMRKTLRKVIRHLCNIHKVFRIPAIRYVYIFKCKKASCSRLERRVSRSTAR